MSQRIIIMFVSMFVSVFVSCYLLILLQSFQSRGGIISDLCSLCRSQSLETSHSTVCCTILSVEMFPGEYLPTQGRDDSSAAGLFQCTVLYHTILYKRFHMITAITS